MTAITSSVCWPGGWRAGVCGSIARLISVPSGPARLWDAASGAPGAVLKGHEGYVQSAAFSPDGKRVVTTSRDRTARLWALPTGNELIAIAIDILPQKCRPTGYPIGEHTSCWPEQF